MKGSSNGCSNMCSRAQAVATGIGAGTGMGNVYPTEEQQGDSSSHVGPT